MTAAWAWPLLILGVLGWVLATLLAAAWVCVYLVHRSNARHAAVDPVDRAFATLPTRQKPPGAPSAPATSYQETIPR